MSKTREERSGIFSFPQVKIVSFDASPFLKIVLPLGSSENSFFGCKSYLKKNRILWVYFKMVTFLLPLSEAGRNFFLIVT